LSVTVITLASAAGTLALHARFTVVGSPLNTGGAVSNVQVTVREAAVAGLPQASVTFQVRVCERLQPVLVTTLSDAVGVTELHVSVAVAVPRAASIAAAVGLQPRVRVVPVAVITGAVVSTVQVTVRDTAVAGLPHASVAFQVRVCERLHPVLVTTLSEDVGVTELHVSVAVAVPRAASIAAAVGLQPRVRVVPVAVITGAVVSTVHVTVRDTAVAGLPHASVAFQVRVCERPHPLIVTALSEAIGVTELQVSVAVAVPSAALSAAAVGLHPRVKVVPLAVITGAVVSLTVIVCAQVCATPQALVTR
jgi:hypothetical protein